MNKLSEYPQGARTSYFGDQIKLSLNDAIMYFGAPTYEDSMDEKVQYEWVFEGEDGNVFTLYNWKQGVILYDQPIAWHIGASSRMASLEGRNELIESINDGCYEHI
jgi:hypothetical protein